VERFVNGGDVLCSRRSCVNAFVCTRTAALRRVI
jgi:hypothetical protein